MYLWETNARPKGVFVIVHGAGEYHVRYEWVIGKLNDLGFHVVIGDLPGQGMTEGPRGHIRSFNEYKHVVKKWLHRAHQYKLPVILLAHSMGGLISIHTILELEKQELPKVAILSSPCLGLANQPSSSKKVLSHFLNMVAPGIRFNSGVAKGTGTRDEWMRERDLQDERLIRRVSVRWYRELSKAIKQAHQQVEYFPNLPLFVMQGGNDLIVNKDTVKQWFNELDITNKYYKEYEGLYHEVLNEPEREQVLADLLGFVTMHLTC